MNIVSPNNDIQMENFRIYEKNDLLFWEDEREIVYKCVCVCVRERERE
jgi:hypothetical protein